MTASSDKDIFPFEEFKGLQNIVDSSSFEPGDLDAALNVDVTDAKKLRRRRGFGAPLFGSAAHSLWSSPDGDTPPLFVSANVLYRLNGDETYASLYTLPRNDRMVYTNIGQRIYFSNGIDTGVVSGMEVRSWGLPQVMIQPTAAQIGGLLPAGRYQYVVTFVRDDGQESGCGLASTIDLTGHGGISFDLIPVPTDANIVAKNLYVSPPDGDKMWLQMRLSADVEQAVLTDYRHGTVALATQFLSAPPAGHILAYFNGRVLVAVGNRLYPSEPYAPELFDLRKSIPFSTRITLVAPVEDGVYLGTESQIVWLPGRDPAQWVYVPRLPEGAIEGTLAYTDASTLTGEQPGIKVAVFASTESMVVGYPDGTTKNMTHDKYRYPIAKLGTAMVRGIGGMKQYVLTLRGATTPNNTAI